MIPLIISSCGEVISLIDISSIVRYTNVTSVDQTKGFPLNCGSFDVS